MSQRNRFQAQMIERLGGPLMAAVTSVGTAAGDGQAPGRVAATMAELLTRSVQFGIALSAGMDLKGSDEYADAIRLALTALAGGLVAEIYRQTGAVPAEADLRKWLPALEAVLIFSDKFAPSADAIMRLDRLQPGGGPVDENQAIMQYMQAFVPVVTEIGAFSFGRQDKKLIQDVADRISNRAEAMAERLFAGAGDAEGLQLKLGTARALACVYVECHRAEKKRLQEMTDSQRAALAGAGGALPLDTLWAAFEQRAAMLEILSEGLFGDGGKAAGTQGGPMPPAKPAAASVASQATAATVSPPPAALQQVPVPPPVSVPEASPPAGGPANPMGFFKPGAKKPPQAGNGAENNDSAGAG